MTKLGKRQQSDVLEVLCYLSRRWRGIDWKFMYDPVYGLRVGLSVERPSVDWFRVVSLVIPVNKITSSPSSPIFVVAQRCSDVARELLEEANARR